MALDFRLPPSIESVAPLGEAVPLDAVIEVQFSTDLDRSVLAGALAMIDPQGHAVPGVLSYEARVLRFKPNVPLKPQTAYTVILQGAESAGSAVVRSIVGTPMGQNQSFAFRTTNAGVVVAPVLVGPADASQTGQTTLSWNMVAGASSYHVQLFSDPSLNALVWESRVVGTSVQPAQVSEGQYWWRAAASDSSGAPGPWSSVLTFQYVLTPPPLPVPVGPPVFMFQDRALLVTPTALEIRWPYPVTLTSLKLFRETIDGTEVEVPTTDTWTESTLRITPNS